MLAAANCLPFCPGAELRMCHSQPAGHGLLLYLRPTYGFIITGARRMRPFETNAGPRPTVTLRFK